MNKKYEQARIRHNKAFETFNAIRKQYRNLEIGDDEFLKARETYAIETEAFDQAFQNQLNPDLQSFVDSI